MGISERRLTILGILCEHAGAQAAETAGMEGLIYSPDVRLMRLLCAADIDHLVILNALWEGVDGIFVVGCPAERGYFRGCSELAQRRLQAMKDLLEVAGLPAERFRTLWIEASDGKGFVSFVNSFYEDIKRLGPWNGFRGKGE